MLLTFLDDALEVWHSLYICSRNIFVLSKDNLDLGAEFLKHIRVPDKKTTADSRLATSVTVELLDLQHIGHCRSCGVSARNKHINDLISDET